MNRDNLSPEILAELEKNAAIEREHVAAAVNLTDAEIAAIAAEYATAIHALSAGYTAIENETEKSAYIVEHIADITEISFQNTAADFVKWTREYDFVYPGLGSELIAAFLNSKETGTITFKRDDARPYIWKYQDAAKENERRAARKIANEKLAARIAKLNAAGFELCDRCGGAGGWKGWPGFTCYKCNGLGSVEMSEKRKREFAKSIAAK